jgi:cyanate permease
MGCCAIGSIIGPTLAGYLFDNTGSYSYTWIMLGIASTFSVVLVLNIGPRKQV